MSDLNRILAVLCVCLGAIAAALIIVRPAPYAPPLSGMVFSERVEVVKGVYYYRWCEGKVLLIGSETDSPYPISHDDPRCASGVLRQVEAR
jgi:hypothetical protein